MVGHLELYIKDVNKTIEMKKDMENIELVCATEFKGSKLLKYIHLIVRKFLLNQGCFNSLI